METFKLALDWTPNTNHTGFFVAKALGYYEAEKLDVNFHDPSSDNYASTPASNLAKGRADAALAPTESILAHRYSSTPAPLYAVAAVLAKDASAIATLTSSGVSSPKDLDGKRYASYAARFEDGIVRQMIRNDGGKGDVHILTPPKLGIWDTLLKGEADATWIFENWEAHTRQGIEAAEKDVNLTNFKMDDFGIPYGYSPLLLVNLDTLKESAITRFLHASRKGFEYATEHPQEAAEILQKSVPEGTSNALVLDSQKYMSGGNFYGAASGWGLMDPNKWTAWLGWLKENGLLKKQDGTDLDSFQVDQLFTNRLLLATPA